LQSAEGGNHLAESYLSIVYNRGGTACAPKDTIKSNEYASCALLWLKAAANSGNASVQYVCGLFYAFGVGEEAQNEVEAVNYYKLAADQGHANAQRNLGFCYANGTGVIKNEVEAARYYQLAADQGHAVAQYNLGFCYLNGTGVIKNEVEAVRYYQLAADQGHANAQVKIKRFWSWIKLGKVSCI
jgi:uncharacterized protein